MSAWIPVVVNVIVFGGGIALQFYFKWVPDVEQQKQHARRVRKWLSTVLWWTLDCGNLVLFSWDLYLAAHHKGPVTPAS